MNPWQLAKDSEESHQMALFCFLNKAERYGFDIAWHKEAYSDGKWWLGRAPSFAPVEALKWLHHIPNGGSRGDTQRSRQIAGGQMKAAGVKSGVWDLFWPLIVNRPYQDVPFCGLYIEMKRPSLKSSANPYTGLSDEQIAFGNFAHAQGYKLAVCYTWEEAAKEIQKYFEQSC